MDSDIGHLFPSDEEMMRIYPRNKIQIAVDKLSKKSLVKVDTYDSYNYLRLFWQLRAVYFLQKCPILPIIGISRTINFRPVDSGLTENTYNSCIFGNLSFVGITWGFARFYWFTNGWQIIPI